MFVKKNDVIQVNELVEDWCGCLMIVDEVHDWGVQAGMRLPMGGATYMRLKHEEYEWIGMAVLAPSIPDVED